MPVFETYASRVTAAEKTGTPDVYTYDNLPSFLSAQISQIFRDCIVPGWKGYARHIPHDANKLWEQIAGIMDKEIQSFQNLTIRQMK
jgi:hypothetical protein